MDIDIIEKAIKEKLDEKNLPILKLRIKTDDLSFIPPDSPVFYWLSFYIPEHITKELAVKEWKHSREHSSKRIKEIGIVLKRILDKKPIQGCTGEYIWNKKINRYVYTSDDERYTEKEMIEKEICSLKFHMENIQKSIEEWWGKQSYLAILDDKQYLFRKKHAGAGIKINRKVIEDLNIDAIMIYISECIDSIEKYVKDYPLPEGIKIDMLKELVISGNTIDIPKVE